MAAQNIPSAIVLTLGSKAVLFLIKRFYTERNQHGFYIYDHRIKHNYTARFYVKLQQPSNYAQSRNNSPEQLLTQKLAVVVSVIQHHTVSAHRHVT